VLNAVMGATLGALSFSCLLALDVHDISRLMQESTSPLAITIILITGTSMYFAFGAAITGFHFAIMDESHRKDRRG
jgi:hypothetical protein